MVESATGVDNIKPTPFIKLRNAVVEAKNAFVHGRPSMVVSEPLVPSEVRYAFAYQDAKFGVRQIESLINNNFSDIANYLLLKALDTNPSLQQEYLEVYADSIASPNQSSDESIQKLQKETCMQLNEMDITPINGRKLAKVMVQGADLWQTRFKEIAQEVKSMPDEPVPVYVAYAGVLGLRQGLETFKDTDQSLLLLMPDRVKNQTSENIGYKISMDKEDGERVEVLPKDFVRPKNYIFIDDARSTDAHINEVWKFWSGNDEGVPDDKIRVVYKTSPNSSDSDNE